MESESTEAQKYVWEEAIPLQIHLHESEVPRGPWYSTTISSYLNLLLFISLFLSSVL